MTPNLTRLASRNALNSASVADSRPALAHSKHLSAQTEEGLQYLIKALAFADAGFSTEIENLLVNAGALAVPHLVNALHSEEVAVASTSAMALIRLNSQAEPVLARAYNALPEDAQYRWRFDFVLNQLGLNEAMINELAQPARLAVVR